MLVTRYRRAVRFSESTPHLSSPQCLVLAIALCAGISFAALSQTKGLIGTPLTTQMHVQRPGWWPTKGQATRKEYTGSKACSQCHGGVAATYQDTGMAHAASLASNSEALQKNDHLFLQLGRFTDKILTAGNSSILIVSDENSKLAQPLGWAFGQGFMGQTYVYERNGSFYESHLSFFASTQALDITPGQMRSVPPTIEDAAGRRMSPDEARLCFGCHTTGSTLSAQFVPGDSVPGVGCESCHGPGATHAALMSLESEGKSATEIFNPGRLGPVDSVDFCGACHRTFQDIVTSNYVRMGVFNVRFAPYRLENSRCWGRGDARLTCIACHDPHKPLATESTSYDAACLRCHVLLDSTETAGHPGAACPVSTKNCVTCHMPKYELPEMHHEFTDHWIRIVDPEKPYPS
jgi:Cytochrome c554 and c-prime